VKRLDETMARGAAQYADAERALRFAGLPATFTQTGAMCAALEVRLETGHTLLITDAEEPLSWTRAEHAGWGVGLYADHEDRDGALAFGAVPDGGVEALLTLVRDVMLQRNGTNTAVTPP